MNKEYVKIGIDIGGSHIGMALIDNQDKIIKKIEEDYISKGDMTEKIKQIIEKGINELIENRTETLEMIGISVPGLAKDTVAINLVNLGIEKIDFKYLKDKFNTKVHTINDGNAAAIAEKRYGALKDYKDCIFFGLGTGIGSAVFLKGEMLTNSKNSGTEIGHMVIQKDGKPCNCGKRGCWEKYCSMKEFRKNIKEILEKFYPDKSIFDKVYLTDLLKEQNNNLEVQKIIDEYIDNLIIGFSNMIDLFEPEAICLGGSFVYYKDFMYDKLVSEVNKRKYAFYKDSMPKIVLAEFKNDAGIIGSICK